MAPLEGSGQGLAFSLVDLEMNAAAAPCRLRGRPCQPADWSDNRELRHTTKPCRMVFHWSLIPWPRPGQVLTDMFYPVDPEGLYIAIKDVS